MRITITAAALLVLWASPTLAEEKDERAYWVYEGGWFAKADGASWIEMNAETYDKNKGEPWRFKEVKRTAEFVELRDASRKVSVRLTETSLDCRADGETEWKTLYKGRWKNKE